VEVKLHIFLTSALDGFEWLASRPGHFNPKEWAPVRKSVPTPTEWMTLTRLFKKNLEKRQNRVK
jgi:hypothetical protein